MSVIHPAPIADLSVLRRSIDEVWHGGDLGALDELYEEGYVGHDPFATVPSFGRDALRRRIGAVRTAFGDLRLEVDDIVIAGDRLAYRYVARGTHTGALGELAATGRRVTVTGLQIARFGASGRIGEEWICWDALGLLRQLDLAACLDLEQRPSSRQATPVSTEAL